MCAELADCNPSSAQHCPGTSALAGGWSIGKLQSHRIANSRVVRISETVRTIDRVGTVDHEIVNLDRIPVHRPGMDECNQGVKAIKHLSGGVIHEKLAFLRDGVSKVRAQSEKKTDRIRWTRRHHDMFPRFACLLS